MTIHEANFSQAELEDIPAEELGKLSRLYVLDVSHNKLEEVPKAVASVPTLTELHMSDNHIMDLDGSPFSMLPNLMLLNLSNNFLMGLGEDDFVGLDGLQYLYLKLNMISTIHPQTFQPLKNLIKLDIDFNHFRVIEHGVFSNLPSLADLSLSLNFLLSLVNDTFQTPSLTVLTMNGNVQMTIPPNMFMHCAKSIKSISMHSNNLRKIDAFLFQNLTALEKLDLSNNEISYIPGPFLQESRDLKALILQGNKLQYYNIPHGFFQNFPQLKLLSLGGNPISEVPDVQGLKQLKYLDLMSTSIKQVWPCQLGEQSKSQKDFYLYLSNNPLTCDCQLRWLKLWRESGFLHEAENVDDDKSSWICEYPLQMKGRLFDNVTIDELECENDDQLPTWCKSHVKHISHPVLKIHIDNIMANSLQVSWKITSHNLETLSKIKISWITTTPSNGKNETSNNMMWVSAATSNCTINKLQPKMPYKICISVFSLVHKERHFLAENCTQNIWTNKAQLSSLLTHSDGIHSDTRMEKIPIIVSCTFVLTAIICTAIALTVYFVLRKRKLAKRRGEEMKGANMSVIHGVKNLVYGMEQADEAMKGADADGKGIVMQGGASLENAGDCTDNGHSVLYSDI